MAQNMGDWMEYAREYAKAQREMKIEKMSLYHHRLPDEGTATELFCSAMTFTRDVYEQQ